MNILIVCYLIFGGLLSIATYLKIASQPILCDCCMGKGYFRGMQCPECKGQGEL